MATDIEKKAMQREFKGMLSELDQLRSVYKRVRADCTIKEPNPAFEDGD